MNFLVYSVVIMSIALGCKGQNNSSTTKKEGITEQPTDVSGGFGLTMQCSVMNKEVPNATSSEIGCIVNNDDGSKFTGKIEDLKASITAKGQSTPINATPQKVEDSATLSISLNVDGLTPTDAQSIEIFGKFDEKPATLTATLKGRFALICDEDVTYYVNKDAPTSQLSCTEDAPCQKISHAISLLPDVFNCRVTIKVAAGRTYSEQIKISGKQVTDKGFLRIVGVPVAGNQFADAPAEQPSSDADYATIIPPTNLQALTDLLTTNPVGRTAITIRSFSSSVANVSIENMIIDGQNPSTLENQKESTYTAAVGKFETAVFSESSFTILKNTKMRNFRNVAVRSINSSRTHFDNTELINSLAGIEMTDSYQLSVSNSLTINGPAGDASEDTINYIENDASVGIKLTRSVLSTLQNPQLHVNGLKTGINLVNSSVELSPISQIQIRGTHTGLKLESGSDWNWNPPLQSSVQPQLAITKCSHTCIEAQKSTFTMETDPSNEFTAKAANLLRPRLTLRGLARQLEPENASNKAMMFSPEYIHYGIIKAGPESHIKTSYIENIWCDVPNDVNSFFSGTTAVVFLNSSATMVYKRAKGSLENGCSTSENMVVSALRSPEIDFVEGFASAAYTSIRVNLQDQPGDYTNMTYSQTYLLSQFKNPAIVPYHYSTPAEGSENLEISTESFKTITSVTVGGVAATIVSFDAKLNEPGAKQTLIILPPTHSATPSSLDYQDLVITGTSASIAETEEVSLTLPRAVEYQ